MTIVQYVLLSCRLVEGFYVLLTLLGGFSGLWSAEAMFIRRLSAMYFWHPYNMMCASRTRAYL